jgi:glycine cleavage system H protein
VKATDEPNVYVVGITDYAQDQLGDVVYVELPKVGARVEQFKPFGVIESVKTASDLYAPISGEVTAVNEAVVNDPALVNQSPYDEAWLIRVRPSDPTELDRLLTAEQYGEQIAG